LDCGINRVEVQTEEDVNRILGQQDSFMISDSHLPLFVRQIAIHANLAFLQKHQNGTGLPFISNIVERLRSIKRLKSKVGHLSQESVEQAVFSPGLEQNRTRASTVVGRPEPGTTIDETDYPFDFTLSS